MEQKMKYEFSDSLARIDRVLESSGVEYRQFSQIVDVANQDKVKGGFSDAVVIGIRFSFSDENFSRLAQAKIYDILLSEELRIIQSSPLFFSHIVDGHTIKGIFQINQQSNYDHLMDVAAKMLSFMDVLNVKIGRKPVLLQATCAMDSSQLFVSSFSGKNELFGTVIERMDVPLRSNNRKLFVSETVRDMLKEQYRKFFEESKVEPFFEGNVENVGMSQWIVKQWEEK